MYIPSMLDAAGEAILHAEPDELKHVCRETVGPSEIQWSYS